MKKLTALILSIIVTMTTIATASAVDYGAEYKGMPSKTYSQKFNDVTTSHWAFDCISEMCERNVVSGYPNGNFYPNNNVTRAEFARIMTSASGLQISLPTQRDFSDVATDAWYAPYIHAAYPYLSGYQIYGGNYYKPDTPALREDIAVALVKLKGYDTFGVDESMLSVMFTDADSISSEAKKYVAVALERGLVSGYEDNTFRGQSSISRAEATAMLWRAYQYGNDNKVFDVVTTPEPIVVNTPEPMVQTDTPVIIATPDPTVEPVVTPEITVEPTVEPTETPQKKPYVMDTVLTGSFSHMTTSDDTLYYVTDDSIHALIGDNDSEFMNLTSFEYDDCYNFSVVDMEYCNNTLYLSGRFTSKKDPGALKPITCVETYTFDITNPNNPTVVSRYEGIIGGVLPNGNVLNSLYAVDPDTYKASMNFYTINNDCIDSWIIDGSEVYVLSNKNIPYHYDLGKGELVEMRRVTNQVDSTIIYSGKYNNKWLFWCEDGSIVTYDTNGNMSIVDTLNTKNDVSIIDFKAHPQYSPSVSNSEMMINSNGIYFYYDGAIRVIKEA